MFTPRTILSTLLAISTLSVGSLAQTTASDADVAAVVSAYQAASLLAPSADSTDTYQLPDLPALQGTLNAYYGGMEVDLGTLLTQDEVASAPALSITPTSSATAFTSGALFTVILADYDANTTELDAASGQTRHWLVNGANVDTSTTPYNLTYASSTAITDYTQPGPFAYSGAHKYTLLVIAQPENFTAPADLSTAGTALGVFDVNEYISSSGLGDIVATNYFTVNNDPDQSSSTAAASSTATGATSLTSLATRTATGMTTARQSSTSAAASAAATTSAASGAGKVVVGLSGLLGAGGALFGAMVL